MGLSRRGQRGFTLVEMLVVVATLGVLAAIVFISVEGFTTQADRTACATDERQVIDAEEVHHAETGNYVDEAGLVAAGRLRGVSSSHDVVLAADSYDVVAVGSCADEGGGEVASGADDSPADLAERAAQLERREEERAARFAQRAEAKTDAKSIDGLDAGWNAVGAAETEGDAAVLTPEKEDTTGAVYRGTSVHADGMRATFVAHLGKGGEGLAFVLLDPEADVKSTGKGGAGLGFAGLPGYAVTIDTAQSSKAEPDEPFLGLARGDGGLEYLDMTPAARGVLNGSSEVAVEVQGAMLVVTVDGKPVLKQEVKLPPEVIVGFTAATGDNAARHEVAKVQITG